MIFISIILFTITLTGCTKTDTTENKNTTENNDIAEKIDESNGPDNQFKTYENEKLGFTLQFPTSWDDNYIIKEEADYIEVCFVGDSEQSKNYYEDLAKPNGLTMFYIGTEDYVKENPFLDSVKEVGKVNDISYYYFTDTDFPLGALTSEYIEDENEKKLAEDDFTIAMEMIEDVESIIKTFKSLE